MDIGGWTYVARLRKWHLKVGVHHDGTPHLVPTRTHWHFVVSDDYPFGDISVYPDRETGIAFTFPHQRRNSPGSDDLPWKSGNICAATQFQHFGRSIFTQEPWHPADRLRWYALRTVDWVAAAANNDLTSDNDPFERPVFESTDEGPTFSFQENADSFLTWKQSNVISGTVELIRSAATGSTMLASRFDDKNGRPVFRPHWQSRHLESRTEVHRGAWILLSALPVREHYQTPSTWSEFKATLDKQGVPLRRIVNEVTEQLRGEDAFYLLIGYPVKEKVGDDWSLIQWQAAVAPPLVRSEAQVNEHGLRNRLGRRLYDFRRVLADNQPINWRPTKNWDRAAITSRGKLPDLLATSKMLIIGAGALGALVAEQFVRGGAKSLTVIDRDTLEIGNLVRHTLSMATLGEPKSRALASHLESISPNIAVTPLVQHFGRVDAGDYQQFDLIVDTTGSDEIPHVFEAIEWTEPKTFVSVSVSLGARQLYFYIRRSRTFNAGRFLEAVEPIIAIERAKWKDEDIPREEQGCFNPVFPGRLDDMILMVSAAVKELSIELSNEGELEVLVTFQQTYEDDIFTGISRAKHPI